MAIWLRASPKNPRYAIGLDVIEIVWLELEDSRASERVKSEPTTTERVSKCDRSFNSV